MASPLKEILKTAKGMIISGTAASEAIDSSGEILNVEGCDISNIDEGTATLNWEHQSDTPTDTVGRIVYGKKIYSEKDCEDDNQLMYWKHSGVPLIYIIGELMDQDDHKGAKDLAAMVRHYADRNLPLLTRFSIEGSTINRKGNVLKESVLKAVAVTAKPCNKDAISGLLFDPLKTKRKDTVKEIAEKFGKFENPNTTKLGGSVEIECNPMVKTEPDLKSKIKDLMKDWNGEGDVKAFIKSKLPEVSDEYLDTFENAIDNFRTKIKRIKKFEALAEKANLLTKALQNEPEPEEQHVEFGGKKILPGKAEYMGRPIALLGHDHAEQSVIGINAGKVGGWADSDIRKIPVNHNDLRIRTLPTEVNTPPTIDSTAHGVNLTPEAARLVHGLELDPNKAVAGKGKKGATTTAYWTKNAEGKLVFVKPDMAFDSFGDAARESAFHNVAHQFFGMGQYLPTVAAVRHPATGHMHAVIEAVPGEHTEQDSSTWSDKPNIPNNQEHINTLHKLAQSGELDKLHMMDHILANPDRHAFNYLFTPEGSMKVIDHGLAFDRVNYEPDRPDYQKKYANILAMQGRDHNREPSHPQSTAWLMSLNPKALKQTLRANGVPLEYANESVRRLATMQEHLNNNPTSPRWDLHNAPHGNVRLA